MPCYTQKIRQHHADFTVAQARRYLPDCGWSGPPSVLEVTLWDIEELSLEDLLHVRGISERSEAREVRTHEGPALETPSMEPFVPTHHYLNRRTKALIDSIATNGAQAEQDIRLFATTYVFCDQKVSVLVKAAMIAPKNDADVEAPKGYQCLYAITRLEPTGWAVSSTWTM